MHKLVVALIAAGIVSGTVFAQSTPLKIGFVAELFPAPGAAGSGSVRRPDAGYRAERRQAGRGAGAGHQGRLP